MTILKAKAKVNLFFHLVGKRDDGYHLIESLVVFTDEIYDLIDIAPAPYNSTSVNGDIWPNNIIDLALDLFTTSQAYHCSLTKNIPIGAGLGGGSSDAAAVARFLNQHGRNIQQQLVKLGADVPVCYIEEPAFCSGIGEETFLIKNFHGLYLLLVNPRCELLTKTVFQANKKIDTAKLEHKPLDFLGDTNKMVKFLAPLANDLTEAAVKLIPEIELILNLLAKQNGCKIARMSGSGPTCFAVFTDLDLARIAQENIMILKPEYWLRISRV